MWLCVVCFCVNLYGIAPNQIIIRVFRFRHEMKQIKRHFSEKLQCLPTLKRKWKRTRCRIGHNRKIEQRRHDTVELLRTPYVFWWECERIDIATFLPIFVSEKKYDTSVTKFNEYVCKLMKSKLFGYHGSMWIFSKWQICVM